VQELRAWRLLGSEPELAEAAGTRVTYVDVRRQPPGDPEAPSEGPVPAPGPRGQSFEPTARREVSGNNVMRK